MYQRKVDVDMLNAVKSVLTDVLNVSPSSEQSLVVHRIRKLVKVMVKEFALRECKVSPDLILFFHSLCLPRLVLSLAVLCRCKLFPDPILFFHSLCQL